MNEFDVVRGIGADTPDPDAATTSAARVRLLAAIRAEAATGRDAVSDMAVDLGARGGWHARRGGAACRRVRPSPPCWPPPLLPLVLHDPAPVTRERGPGTSVAGDVLATAEPAAVKVLTTAAVAAARTLEPPFGPGDYWYVRERGTKVDTNFDQAGSPKSFFYRTPFQNETWWALDGETRTRTTSGRPRFLTPAERAAWVAAGRPKINVLNSTRTENPRTSDRSDGWLPLTYEQIIKLPTDPARGSPMSCPSGSMRASRTGRARSHRIGTVAARLARAPTGLSRTWTGSGAIVFLVTNYPPSRRSCARRCTRR